MALPDLSGSFIQDSYQRVLHTDGTSIFDGTGSTVLSSTNLSSLQTMNNNTISEADWGYVETMDQHLNQAARVAFSELTASTGVPASGAGAIIGAATGAFDHIITTGETIQFRNKDTKAIEGHLKFSPTTGLQIQDENKERTKLEAAAIYSAGNLTVDGNSVQNTIEANSQLWTKAPAYAHKIRINGTTGQITASGRIETSEDVVAAEVSATNIRVTNLTATGRIKIKGSDITMEAGHISMSGDLRATGSFIAGANVSAGDNGTGSFDHIITTNNTIEFRDAVDKTTVKGYLKFDDTYGFAALGANKAEKLIQAHRLRNIRTIGGVSFNGSANINLPGVNANQTTASLSWAGNAGSVTNGVYTSQTQTIGGAKTFTLPITGSLEGNAKTATTVTTYKNGNKYFLTPSDFTPHRVVPNFGPAGTFISFGVDEKAFSTFTLPINSKIFKLKSNVTATGGSFTMSSNYFNGQLGPAAGVLCTSLVNQAPPMVGAAKFFDASQMYISIEYNTPPGGAARLFSAYVDWIIYT